MMRFGELLADYPAARWSSAAAVNTPLQGICQDSREVRPGDLFLAFPGAAADGRQFMDSARARSAGAVLLEDDGREIPEPGAGLASLREAAGPIAARFYGDPSAALDVVAVTGTNGKTSCSNYVAQLLADAGQDCGVIGTLGSGSPGDLAGASLTTPEPVRLQSILASFVAQGRRCAALEASSHGLVQGRLNGTRVRVAVFTNITRDHLDYHVDFDAYKDAKALLLQWPGLSAAVVNLDDPWGAELAQLCDAPVTSFSCSGQAADITATGVAFGPRGTSFVVSEGGLKAQIKTRLIAGFNVSNALAAFAAVRALGVPFAVAARALASLRHVRGRMELIEHDAPAPAPAVMVDYAHTPDALGNALAAARHHCDGRLWVVFGCGGDRDRGKRAEMGRIAAQLADEVVLTSDNPRTENPASILADIAAGLGNTVSVVQPDRADAIRQAIFGARAGDLVVIAGKGHEDYQEIDGKRRAFSDFEAARAALGAGSWM